MYKLLMLALMFIPSALFVWLGYPIIAGILFVLITVRILPKLVYEIAFLGAIFGFFELWHYHGTAFLGMPDLPLVFLQFAAALGLTWIVLRLILIFSLFIPQLKPIVMILEGK